MNESSNYDGVPPVPPASGVWRQPGPREFEAKYVFFSTKPPAKFEDIASGGGWLPAGRGGLTERILVAADGRHFKSKLRYEAFDTGGKRLTAAGRPRVLVSASNLNRWTCCCSLGEISRATLGLEFSTRSVIRRRND